MACTIDHLRPDHAVRVLQDFTDARGRSHRAGEKAIIRAMGLDTLTREIWIDWEQDGVVARLFFALASPTGPRSGAMREYFELGDEDASAAPPSAAVLLPPRQEGVRESTRPVFAGGHPPAETNLGEVSVACGCDPKLHRAVLLEFTGVNACLRCGTVTCSRSVGDDGRFTGDAWQSYLAVAVSADVLDWLAKWPRVTVRRHRTNRWPTLDELGRRDVIYLPADTRCETAAELEALENARLGRTDEADFPTAAPPADLPEAWQGYRDFWSALRLTPKSDLAELIGHAQLRCAGSAFAVQRLLRRADAFDVMVRALRSPDRAWQSAGIALARAARPVDPRLPAILIDILQGLSRTPLPEVPGRIVSCGCFESLLIVIADLGIATPAMLAALKGLQRELIRDDATLVSAIGIVLRELQGIPEPTTPPGFLP